MRVLFTNDLIKKTERAMGLIMVLWYTSEKTFTKPNDKVFYEMEIPEMVKRWFNISII